MLQLRLLMWIGAESGQRLLEMRHNDSILYSSMDSSYIHINERVPLRIHTRATGVRVVSSAYPYL